MFISEPHVNQRYKNKTLLWHGCDSEELFEKNKVDPRIIWCLDQNIDYTFNSYGFRSQEFSGAENILSLGCSFSFGTGLPYETTWSYLISKELNLANFNLSIDGSSADCCFRMAYNWIPQLKPKIVLYQNPELSRIEWFDNDSQKPHNLLVSSNNHPTFYKEWVLDERNSKFNHLKNLYAIQQVAESCGAKFVHIPLSSIKRLDYARDAGHYGPRTHRSVADQIIQHLI